MTNTVKILKSLSFYSYEDQVCHMPKLDINNSEIMQFLKYQPPLKCSDEEDWVEIDGSSIKIKESMKAKYGDIKCQFTGTNYKIYDLCI